MAEQDLPVPRLPEDHGQWERVLSPDWAQERLRAEVLEGVDDVRRWLRAVA